jgi:FAD/FMN-containing dehydrogenase
VASRHRISRRRFIGTATAAGASLSPLVRQLAAISPAAVTPHEQAFRSFGEKLRGHIILPNDPSFDAARRIFSWNPVTEKRPVMIVKCADADDVALSIEFARRFELETAVRSGGHDVLGQSICDGIVIDLGEMKAIEVNARQSTALVGAGIHSGELNSATLAHGLAAALGCNPAVGVAGLTLGGGLGWLMGKHGATCDNVRAMEVVTADGRRLVANDRENAELFWGLRGGGGNFGVVTKFEYALHRQGEIFGGFAGYVPDRAPEFYGFYRDYMKSAPDELAIETSLDSHGLTVVVCYSGDPANASEVLRPLIEFGTPAIGTFRKMPYLGLQSRPQQNTNAPKPPPPPFIYWKGGYLAEITDAAIELIIQSSKEAHGGWSFGLGHFMHGAICRVPAEQTALLRFAGGCSYFVNQGWNTPAEAKEAMAWVDRTWERLQPLSRGKAYVNYLSASGPAAVASSYGENYPRLRRLKQRYDPDNFFHLNRNVRLG